QNPEWARRVGGSTEVSWPVGKPATGNAGGASLVTKTEGAIGYVELTYALARNRPFGGGRNRAGRVVQPRPGGGAARAPRRDDGADWRFALTDRPWAGAYPIAGASWALVPVKPDRPKPEVVKFLEWVTHEGQAFAAPQHFAPLPEAVTTRLDETFRRLQP